MTAKDFLDRAAEIKDSGHIGSSFYRDKATVGGACIGLALGAYYGYTRKQNMLVTSIFGLVAGGLVSRVVMPA